MNTTSSGAGITEAATFSPFLNNLTVNVAIVGGGITGITAAYILAQAGKWVAVPESWDIAWGLTGFSTGNLYAPVSEQLYKIEQRSNQETRRTVTTSRSAAVDFVEQRVTPLC
jgi:glycine/D-amino acid oxidase-like deaminating enzyme